MKRILLPLAAMLCLAPGAFGRSVNLATLESDYTAANLDTLYGTLSGNYRISIAAGAKVMLRDAVITNCVGGAESNYAGLTCIGNATIQLVGESTVEGLSTVKGIPATNLNKPGIYVPEGDTLTITGSGTLRAFGSQYGAGIGGGCNLPCGNISIEGGTVMAYGGVCSAAIGSGDGADCGLVSICEEPNRDFGYVFAMAHASGGVCIGAGSGGSCDGVDVGGHLTDSTNGELPARLIMPWNGDLGALDQPEITALDGMTIGMVLASPCKVNIADGATVTLSNAYIKIANAGNCGCPGLTCLGEAEIVLAGTNQIEGLDGMYPGIYVPEDAVLTIGGTGTLKASGGSVGMNYGAAGIGGGNLLPCGSIEITGGNVVATGNSSAAGIGGGYGADCGDIVISGGTVIATGGDNAPGIGCGYAPVSTTICGYISITGGHVDAKGGAWAAGIGAGAGFSHCGDVEILEGIESVKATSGEECGSPIGFGDVSGGIGSITVAESLDDRTEGSTRTIRPCTVYGIIFHRNEASDGWRADYEFDYGVLTALPTVEELGWARRGFEFKGWATSAANAARGKVWKTDGAAVSTAAKPGKTLHVYAVWALKNGYYAINFIRNDGAGTWRTVGFKYGAKTRMPSVANGLGWARRGYDFMGWELTTANANDNTRASPWKGDWAYVSKPVMPGKTLTAYARWRLKGGYYEIRFNKNDGSGKWRTLGYECGKRQKLSTIAGLGWTRSGYSMAGWGASKANADAGKVWKLDGAWVKDGTAEGKTLSIYAIWD
ncbi:MAG: hypothetical protein K6F50_01690 [Kiritimatiellae bacterium]|nr:hypothetical protein [Kiritimatiellia bacterium]